MSLLRLICVVLCAAVAAACSEGTSPPPAITVTSVSPNNGPLAGGTAVTITGTSFPATVDSVHVGTGRLGSLVRVSATQLTGTTPAGSAAGAVTVTVFTTSAGNGSCTGCFTYNPAVTVSAVSPNSGPVAGGTAVTITGANFPLTIDSVRVWSGRLDALVRLSGTQLTGTTPVGSAVGAVDVVVYTTSGGNGTCTGCFTYNPPVTVTSLSPLGGPLGLGTGVTITGTNFPTTVDSVLVGTGRLENLVRVSGTQLTGTTPAGSAAGAVDVVVYTVSAGNGTCTGCFTYAVFARYSVTFLGAGFDSSQAADINDSGSVVGKVWSAAIGWRGRLWPNTGAATDLGLLLPVALNNSGSVLGQVDTVPALWESGEVRTLGGLGALGRVFATDINDHREVALWDHARAFLWRNDSLTALQLPTGIQHGIMSLGRMNNRGQVAATGSSLYPQAVVLTTTTVYYFGGGGRWSSAVAVNDSGRVIGSAEYVLGLASCGYLFGYGCLWFSPRAISNALQIVGSGGRIWKDGATVGLTALVLDSAWTVSDAFAINERGQIAAYGVNSTTGARGAIRLDPVATALGSAAGGRR